MREQRPKRHIRDTDKNKHEERQKKQNKIESRLSLEDQPYI